ncbi:hypothetical protein [Flavilitoribacter nigricans]|uniref:DUF3300 domain-containing protein n=1 Tax=Flavilitoribacter nigricans (strain ATCC 23147 / DSM 23189 / NBRC 102662 / NCIMB 1420 / SS-2) TaxID=1122177 RepID=A0A2D0NIM9_FLAN2|nr:hypothetical protein [Flavilitoribacter nigricans]PHN08216.1 hypothetical protein CRP01_02525 [Flavilitoribacter nigricans DSM 23189 = NBRC 102662]
MKTKIAFLPWIFGWLILFPFLLSAQPDPPLFDGWEANDKAAIEALVMYPQDTRSDILEAAKYPELLIKIESLQNKTSRQFRQLIASLDQDQQNTLYDLARYPGLVSRLALAEEIGARNIEDILVDYPEVIHARARQAFRRYGGLLLEMDEMHLAADHQFNVLIATYPSDTREAYLDLVDLPEVLSLLTENIRMTILVGDLYRKDPEQLNRQMDSLNLVVAEANTRELETWQKSVGEDPEVMAELRTASEEFAEEYGYDDVYYAYDDMYAEEEPDRDKYVIEQYFYYNYPYWFGFPNWYYYPRWRPYPIWYESGFYVVLDGTFIINRLPSFYFTFWYFNRPYHHYYYPHLSRQFVRHTYYGPRPGTSSIAVNVRSWQQNNREVITEAWLQDDRNSIERFREYGKFELDRAQYNRKKLEKELSPTEYLDRHRNKYPELNRTNAKRSAPTRTITRPDTNVPRTAPQSTPPRQTVPRRVEPDRIRITPRVRIDTPPKKEVPKINKGVDQHRRTIERSKTPQPRVTPRTTPRMAPKVPPRIVPKTKKKKGNG